MIIDNKEYKEFFKDFTLVDATVLDRGTYYFVLVSTSSSKKPRTTRIVECFLNKEERPRLFSFDSTEIERMRAGVTHLPEPQFNGVDSIGQVLFMHNDHSGTERQIPYGEEGVLRGGVRKSRLVNGKIHISTGHRGLARRERAGEWVSLCKNNKFEHDGPVSTIYGFDDFDAFNENDFYCVGGKGDAWHFDGEKWRVIDFPSNMYLESVCCADDGFVYIGAQSGTVFKGRDDEWELIYRGHMTLPFKDMVWFNDRVYCTSDYGLWEIIDGIVQEADIPAEVKICSGNLSVGDGVMLLAGVHGAAVFDGQTWQPIFDHLSF